MDKILDEFKNWPDQIVSCVPLIAEKTLIDFVISVTRSVFIGIFLKLADKVDTDKNLVKFSNWPDRVINLRVTSS